MNYALVNTMGKNDTVMGQVLSCHRDIEAAEKADSKIQKSTKRANGGSSYLPTTIVEVTCHLNKGDYVYRHQILKSVTFGDATAKVPHTDEGRAWISDAKDIMLLEETEENAQLWDAHSLLLGKIGGHWE